MNVMHYDPTKALSMNLFMYEELMHNNLASWLHRIDEIVDSGRKRDGGLALVRQIQPPGTPYTIGLAPRQPWQV
eukprot:scaffold117932_cov42-Cyclotella_meneghiniana.AAC.1